MKKAILFIIFLLLIVPTSAFTTIKTKDLIINYYCNNRIDYYGYYYPMTTKIGKINIYDCKTKGVLEHEMAHHYCWVNYKYLSHNECFKDKCKELGGISC